jgi:hypothetical protein
MKLNEALQILIKHQAWRLGEHDNATEPKDLTEAMNVAIEVLDKGITELSVLEDVKSTFELHSDHSTSCNGYYSLCRRIEQLKTNKNE